jgi:hypothetical protein
VLARSEHSVLRAIVCQSYFGQFRAAPMHLCRVSRLWHALQSSVASQHQDQRSWGLLQFTSCRTIKPNEALKRTVRMKLLAKIVHLGPHGRLA